MKRSFCLSVCLCIGVMSYAQETRIDITGFEDLGAWAYTGGGVLSSFVDFPAEAKIPVHEGEAALFVEYAFDATYPWSWNQLNFQAGAVDLTGMRELHMWVYFEPDAVGDLSIRVDVGGGSLGSQFAPTAGQWHELVWKIDRLTSESRINSVSNLGGFLCPGSSSASGKLWIDEIYFVRPAGVVELESVLVYGFNKEDANVGGPEGWQALDGDPPTLGVGDVDPAEGTNYMEVYLGSAYVDNVRAIDAKSAFNRWPEVQEISIDARTSIDYTGGWVQSDLRLRSGANDENGNAIPDAQVTGFDEMGKEIGFSGSSDSWKTLLWQVDMSKHADAFKYPGGWFYISFTTNNDAAQAGARVFFDNLRVSVPKTPMSVTEWSLY